MRLLQSGRAVLTLPTARILDVLSRILREEGMGGKIIDVVDDEDGEHVEIFIG